MTDKELLEERFKGLDELYGVSREFEEDDCEYEVTKKAMLSYLKYPCYEKWIPFLYGGTREDYLNYDRVLKNGYRGDKDYRGAYLLRNNDSTQVLTADVLTSITSLCSRFGAGIEGKVHGEDIKKSILEGAPFNENRSFPKALIKYIKAFAYVYYWCGNMMPVISSFHPGRYGADNWVYKISILKEYNERGKHQDWRDWIKTCWNGNLDGFTKENYLIDCFDNEKIKTIVEDNQIYSLTDKNVEILFKDNYKLAKQLLVNHAKFIIQRSYRIKNQFLDDWDEENKKRVQQILGIVFEKAGIKEKDYPGLQELF